MLRTTIYLALGLSVLPSAVFAQGADCPFAKHVKTQESMQRTELKPVAVKELASKRAQISTPPLLTTISQTPSLAVAPERGVETSSSVIAIDSPAVSANVVRTAEALDTAENKNEKAENMAAFLHAPWNDILQAYVSAPDGMGLTHFDYARLKSSSEDKLKLDRYIKSLEATNPSALSENEAIAFWANLYNAVTIQVVTDNYPVKSIRKLGSFNSGPWKKNLVTVNGAEMSLDDIEHETLRKKFPSPYIHYMVNCASVGCPNLLNEAWEADSLMVKRKAAAADYINSPRGAVASGDKLTVSSIYDWFEEDFGGSKEGVIEHLSKYATGDLADAIKGEAKIKKYDYDWSLNN